MPKVIKRSVVPSLQGNPFGSLTLRFEKRPWCMRVEDDDGIVWGWRTGDVEFADGSRRTALFQFCETDGLELYNTFINVLSGEAGIWCQDYNLTTETSEDGSPKLPDKLAKALDKTYEDVFPYRYRYEGPAPEWGDHKGGGKPDVWSPKD